MKFNIKEWQEKHIINEVGPRTMSKGDGVIKADRVKSLVGKKIKSTQVGSGTLGSSVIITFTDGTYLTFKNTDTSIGKK